MNRGTLFAAFGTLIASGLLTACRSAAEPELVTTVDSLASHLAKSRDTLVDLDTNVYATADSLLTVDKERFLQRFNDTLDRTTATLLGDQFLRLRDAEKIAQDHRTIHALVVATNERISALRTDLLKGAFTVENGRMAVQHERSICLGLDSAVEHVLTAHGTLKKALQRVGRVDSLLSSTGPNEPPR